MRHLWIVFPDSRQLAKISGYQRIDPFNHRCTQMNTDSDYSELVPISVHEWFPNPDFVLGRILVGRQPFRKSRRRVAYPNSPSKLVFISGH
jgi:hypothetical protein